VLLLGVGWLLWDAEALSGELGTVAGGAARFAFDSSGRETAPRWLLAVYDVLEG